jgi:spermidine/putrescine transport system substrate-binding protein
MGIKRLALTAVVAGLAVLAIFALRPNGRVAPLRICTWANYYSDDILADFTKMTGVPLEISYISSNEELLAKFKAGATGFDLIQPSDYMVTQMIRLSMLQAIDHSQLPHLDNLEPFYRDLPYDRGLKYSVPFDWGTTGIVVNTDMIAVPSEGVSWKLLFDSPDPKHTAIFDDMREVFLAMILYQGEGKFSKTPAALQEARNGIAGVKNRILMFTSEPKPLILNGELTIAQAWSVDGLQMERENPKLKYYIPKEGASLWSDNFAIPTTSRRVADAHRFIDFFLEAENAARISLQSRLATPNRAAKSRLPASDLKNPMFYPPPAILKKTHLVDELSDVLPTINRMWTDLKSSG